MKVVKLTTATALTLSLLGAPFNVLADQQDIKGSKTPYENVVKQSNLSGVASTKKFDHFSNNEYSKLFKVEPSQIKGIKNNGGSYWGTAIGKAIDGNLDTYWETNKSNSSNFTNEVEVEFTEAVELNRVVYGARKSDNSGFAEEFEIYASQTSEGDTYKLVTTGGHTKVGGLIETKFDPTTFKRVKFKIKKSDKNWATLSEIAFYKVDAIQEKVTNVFTDATLSGVTPEYNSLDKLLDLEKEVQAHPLQAQLTEQLNLAKRIIKGEVDFEETIVTAEQRGDMKKHALQNLRMPLGTNSQPTGMTARGGDKVTVYVDSVSGTKLPSLVFTQHEGSWSSWERTVQLFPGKNIITVPDIPKDGNYNKKVTKGGSIYIVNPYTPEEQGKAPIIRIEGAEKTPLMTSNTNPEEFKASLVAYKKRLDEDKAKYPNIEDRQLVDVVEVVSEHVMFTGSTTSAYKAYITDGKEPMATLLGYDTWMKQIFDVYGLDGRSISHDPKRIRENIRTMQPWGFMYAATNHTGIQTNEERELLGDYRTDYPGWGLNHEIGHRMDIPEREYTEITNNMLSMRMSIIANKMDTRMPFERDVYKYVFAENNVTMGKLDGGAREAAFWQLELAHEGYWGELNGLYRERKVSLAYGDKSKQQYLIEFSSEVLGMDLSSHFARHGFTVSAETKEKLSKYPKPKKNIWYLNNSVVGYEGTGFNKDASFKVEVKSNTEKKENTLVFDMNKDDKNDLLGYEVLRDGKIVGFTSTEQFVDKGVDASKNYTYQVIAYDKKLDTLKPLTFTSFKPVISIEEYVTLKLNQEFNPLDYVSATSYDGKDITKEIVIKSSNVDVTKKGNYKVVYEVKNEDAVETKTTNVTVTSDYTYISDMDPVSAKTTLGSLKKDLGSTGKVITLVRQGAKTTYKKGVGIHANSEIIYDVEGKGFNNFESYIGIDQFGQSDATSATFEVWVDGEKKFESKVFKGKTEHDFIKVPIAGAKEVKLITTDAKHFGNNADHTVWADAKFTQDSSNPVMTVDEDLTFVKVNSVLDVLQGVKVVDAEDGDLTDQVKVKTNDFDVSKTGVYTVDYSVTDSEGNTVTKTKEFYVYSDTEFASDTDWESAQTDWKTVNKDKSSIGGMIKLLVNGESKEFIKGVGTHANSKIIYNLEGKNYDYFETLVGIDRGIEENSNSSVTFKVLADGVEVYNSGVMNYNSAAKSVKLPVTGVKTLTLIASDSGNGVTSDHADFADAKFYISNGLPQLTIPKSLATKIGTPIGLDDVYTAIDAEDGDLTSSVQVTGLEQVNFNRAGKYEITYTVIDSDKNEITKKRVISVVDMDDYSYLSDLEWKSAQNNYTTPLKDITISAKMLGLTSEDGSGVVYKKGIWAHSTSTIVYDLTDQNADLFTSFVGVDRQMYGTSGSVAFQVFVDGKMEFDSETMNSKDAQKYVEVNISGARELKLVVTDGGNGNGSDHATWGDAKLHYAIESLLDTHALVEAIAKAKQIDVSLYTTESIDSLQEAITQAEQELANNEKTQVAIDKAVTMLTQAMSELVEVDLSQVISVTDNALNTVIK